MCHFSLKAILIIALAKSSRGMYRRDSLRRPATTTIAQMRDKSVASTFFYHLLYFISWGMSFFGVPCKIIDKGNFNSFTFHSSRKQMVQPESWQPKHSGNDEVLKLV